MTPIRLVIFDYDGTLADSGHWLVDNINRFAVRHSFRQVSHAEIETLRGMPTREAVRYLGVRPWRMGFIARDMRRAAGEPGSTPRLFDGISNLLSKLQAAGIAIAVVSSNSEANIRRGLGPTDAARISAYDCGASLYGKAGKLRRLARRMRVPPSSVLCVGDDSRDIDAAHKAGLRIAAVSWGYATESALKAAGPDFLCHGIDELAAVIGLTGRG